MTGQPLQLQRTTYRDPVTGQVRPGGPTYGESALDMEQYYQPLERFHTSSLHGWGVAAGLRVTATLNSPGVTVLPGIALDSTGMHVFLISGELAEISKTTPGTTPLATVTDGGVTIPTDGQTGDQYLVVQFWETFDSQAQNNGIFRYMHTPWLHFVDAAHLPHDGSSITLAKVSFGTGATTGQVTALEDMRQRADWHVERTHEASIHGAGIAAGLGVMATLNTAGVTVLPGIALDGNGQYLSFVSGGQAEIGPGADVPGAAPTLVSISDTGVVVPTTGLNSDKYLTIQFWETATGETLAPTLQSVAPFHFVHTPWLRLLDVAGFVNDGTRIILARVSFGTGANAGLVTNLTVDQRQETGLAVGSIYLQRGLANSPSTNVEAITGVEAGAIAAYPTGGLDITAPNATDEIHLERKDGGNLAKVSLGAEKVVMRRGDGVESIVIDTEASGITGGNIVASGSVNVGVVDPAIPYPKLTVTGPDATVNIETAEILRVMRHGVGGVKNQNSAGFFVGAFEPGINGRSQLDIKVAGTPGASNTWGSVPDITAMSLRGDGNIVANGNITAGSISTNAVTTSGEVVVKNAPGTETIVLDGNGAMIDVGAPGADGAITVYDKTHTAIFIVNGQNGKTTAKALKVSAGVTAQETGSWALGGFASQSAVGLRAANGGIQADLGTPQYAGDFTGGVNISGSLHVSGPIIKSGGGFKIDHPCDPKSKYLAHSFVESPDMKNIYDGVAVLDANGEAIVELPEWFAALNRDARYQLTCIGDYAPVYIGQKMQGTSFKIAGGKPEMEVSWQVTGIRQDAWARAHPLCTEETKPTEEQGYYLHPEENGADPAMSIHQLHRSQSV